MTRPGRAANRSHARSRIRGVTLIELMVALVLGLIVSSAALTMFITNRQTFVISEGLGRVQESARTAFELMARDVREAGGNACDSNLAIDNVLNTPSSDWWKNFSDPVQGYDDAIAFPDVVFGTGVGERISGTDAIELKSSTSSGATITGRNAASAQFTLNTINHGLNVGDIAMVCDFCRGAILQITSASSGVNAIIEHSTGGGMLPGNATINLGVCVPLSSPLYGLNSTVAKLRASRWYIGNNARGSRSLYLAALRTSGVGVPGIVNEEIAEGVQDMQIGYLQSGATDYVAAGAITDWDDVVAVRFVLTIQATEAVGSDGQPLSRRLEHIVAIRNKAP